MTTNTALTIKVAITLALAAAGIGYIMYTPPTSQISNYEKKPMKTPSSKFKSESASSKNSNREESDSISLTGKKGQYDETRIGKDPN